MSILLIKHLDIIRNAPPEDVILVGTLFTFFKWIRKEFFYYILNYTSEEIKEATRYHLPMSNCE